MATAAFPRRVAWKPALRVLGFAVLVAIVAWRVDPAVVAASWRGAGAAELFGIAALFCTAMVVRVGKWALQLRALGFAFAAPALTRNFLLAVLLGAVTPMRVGEAYRVGAVRFQPERRLEQVALVGASLLLEKAYEVLGLFVLVAAGLFATEGAGAPGLAAVLALVAAGAVFGLCSVGPPAALVRAFPERLRTYAVAPLLRARDGLGGRGRLAVFGLTVLAHALNYAGGLGVYRLFGAMPAEVFLTRAPLVTLSNVLPVSIGGFGVRETAAMELFGRVGYPASSAAVAASLMFLCANLVPMLAWPLIVAWERLDARGVDR